MAQITFQMKLGGMERKRIAGVLAGALEARAEYKSAPAFQYEVGRWLLTKDGVLISPPIDQQLMKNLLGNSSWRAGHAPKATPHT